MYFVAPMLNLWSLPELRNNSLCLSTSSLSILCQHFVDVVYILYSQQEERFKNNIKS